MTDPHSLTVAQAVDPQTPNDVLADIAEFRPDLWVALASNPGLYPGLVGWLRELGEPEIDAALAAGGHQTQARSQPEGVQQLQVIRFTQEVAEPEPVEQPWVDPVAGPVAGPVAPSFPSVPPSEYWGGFQPQGGPRGDLGVVGAYGGVAPGGSQPQNGRRVEPQRKPKKAMWIGLVSAVGVLGIGAIVFMVWPKGDSNSQTELYAACEARDWQACDVLFTIAEEGTDNAGFASTCGDAREAPAADASCVEDYGSAEGVEVGMFSLRVGDCTTLADLESDSDTVPLIPCSQPHDTEIYARTLLTGTEFPGQDVVSAQADTFCRAEFATFVGTTDSESELRYRFLRPMESTWTDQDDREVLCLVISDTGDVTGSLEGAAR